MPNDKLRSKALNRMFKGILTLKTVDECYTFFEDLCSIPELKAFEQRFEVAELLNDDVTYHSISIITKASTATISRINRSLEYGDGGYKMVFGRLKELKDSKDNKEE